MEKMQKCIIGDHIIKWKINFPTTDNNLLTWVEMEQLFNGDIVFDINQCANWFMNLIERLLTNMHIYFINLTMGTVVHLTQSMFII